MTRVYLMHSWRTRWRSLTVLALMVALTGGATLSALAGARLSASALDRFHDRAQTLDVFVAGDTATAEPPAMRKVLDGPLVERTNDLVFMFVAMDDALAFAPTSRRGLTIEQGVLLRGRRADPDRPDEVQLPEAAARSLGLQVGDTLETASLDQPQVTAFLAGVQPEKGNGPKLRLRVVGITRTGYDLTARGGASALFVTTPAFWDKYGGEIGVGSSSHMVRLVDRPGALERFTDAVERAYRGQRLPSINVGHDEQTLAQSITVVTVALVAVAGVLLLAGVVWIGSVTTRHQRRAAADVDVLRTLGASVTDRRIILLGSVVPAFVGGLVLAVLFAVAMSPFLPVGAARRVDPDPGVRVDALTSGVGGVTLLAVLLLIATTNALRLSGDASRSDSGVRRVPPLVDRAARTLRPAPGIGVRFALHAPRRAATAVRPALAGAVVGVIGLVAVVVVGASLQRLVDSPARWGTTWDAAVPAEKLAPAGAEGPAEGAATKVDRARLRADRRIAAAAQVLSDEQVTVNGAEAIAMTIDPFKGAIGPTVIEGRAPRADDEVAVGRETLTRSGARLGETVKVGSRGRKQARFRVVGVIAFPTITNPNPVAIGASFTPGGGRRLSLGDPSGGDDIGTPIVVLRWAPGVDGSDALAGLRTEMRRRGNDLTASGPTPAPEVSGLHDVRRFPLLAGGALGVLGIIATSHALIVTVRRRRLDLGILSALGFTPGQRRTVILGQASTITVIALVVGIPSGAVVGRVVWAAIARSIGLATDASFPVLLLTVGAVALLAAVNVIALFPAWSAGRLRVAEALHSE